MSALNHQIRDFVMFKNKVDLTEVVNTLPKLLAHGGGARAQLLMRLDPHLNQDRSGNWHLSPNYFTAEMLADYRVRNETFSEPQTHLFHDITQDGHELATALSYVVEMGVTSDASVNEILLDIGTILNTRLGSQPTSSVERKPTSLSDPLRALVHDILSGDVGGAGDLVDSGNSNDANEIHDATDNSAKIQRGWAYYTVVQNDFQPPASAPIPREVVELMVELPLCDIIRQHDDPTQPLDLSSFLPLSISCGALGPLIPFSHRLQQAEGVVPPTTSLAISNTAYSPELAAIVDRHIGDSKVIWDYSTNPFADARLSTYTNDVDLLFLDMRNNTVSVDTLDQHLQLLRNDATAVILLDQAVLSGSKYVDVRRYLLGERTSNGFVGGVAQLRAAINLPRHTYPYIRGNHHPNNHDNEHLNTSNSYNTYNTSNTCVPSRNSLIYLRKTSSPTSANIFFANLDHKHPHRSNTPTVVAPWYDVAHRIINAYRKSQ